MITQVLNIVPRGIIKDGLVTINFDETRGLLTTKCDLDTGDKNLSSLGIERKVKIPPDCN